VDAAWSAHLGGKFEVALGLLSRALATASESDSARFARGVVQLARGCAAEARDDFAQIAARCPDYPDLWLNLSVAERTLGNEMAAETAARRAVDSAPHSAAAWCLLGRTLRMKGVTEEAFAAYTQARMLELETGEDARTTALHVVGLYETGHYDAAIRMCEAELPLEPDATANTAYALALLTTGDYARGWEQYEFRWFDEPMRSHRAAYDRPYWVGQSLQGKTILLRGEQGIGDVVQFARYATPLAEAGATVMLHVRAGMAKLASSFKHVQQAVETLAYPPTFDYYVNLMSVPRVMGTTLSAVPADVPYLTVPTELEEKWRARVCSRGFKVGLVWAGNPSHPRDAQRSIPLKMLAPLWSIPDVQYYALQKELRDTDAEHLPSADVLTRLGPELEDLTDAAAAITCMDLLIAVDTSLAHIGGALGKPVWLLLPELPDFRWLDCGRDSPWYPTMRLFRAASGRGWPAVISEVGGSLARLVSGDTTFEAESHARLRINSSNVQHNVPRVAEMRDGIMQFLPEHDDESRSLARYGEYLVGELDLLAKVLPAGGWAVEVGSGAGSHALWLARMLGETGELFLYEPHRALERILRQNLEANRLLDSVTLPRGALVKDHSVSAPSSEPLHSIDDLGLDRLDLLKVRLATALPVLEGASATVWSKRPRILVSCSDAGESAAIAAWLRGHSYRIWRLDTPLFRRDNFNAWPEDVFMGRVVTSLLGIPEENDDHGDRLAHLIEV